MFMIEKLEVGVCSLAGHGLDSEAFAAVSETVRLSVRTGRARQARLYGPRSQSQ